MLNKLRKVHANYQFFVAFEEPFVDSFLSERGKLISFLAKNQQSSTFIQSRNHDPVFSSIIAWG